MTSLRSGLPLAAALIALVALAGTASGHTRSASYSRWRVQGGLTTAQLELSLLDRDALVYELASGASGTDTQALVAGAVTGGLTLSAAGQACPLVPQTFTELAPRAGSVAYEWQVRCAAGAATQVRLRDDLLFDALPGHVHFAVVERGGAAAELVLTYGQRQAAVPEVGQGRALDSIARHVRLGVTHILSGWDHLLFVLTLLLCARGVRQVAGVVTGFTVGHSLTLALSAGGYARVDMAGAEALIGLSIALLALDAAWSAGARTSAAVPRAAVACLCACAGLGLFAGKVAPLALLGLALFCGCYFALLGRTRRPASVRAAVAALFGLLHGFGFAGALPDVGAGISLPALFGFNLGVELGQLAVVILTWPMLVHLRRRFGPVPVIALGATASLMFGVALFTARAY